MKLPKVAIYILVGSLSAVSASIQAKMICWTNHDGVKECGDRLPPEYAQQEHQELNKKGMVVDETARAKTDEEIAEGKKQAEAEAEKERIAKESARNDKILLDTYGSVDDVEMARDGKIVTINSSISLAEKRGAKLQAEYDRQVNHAASAEREGKAPPEHLLEDIESLKRQIKINNDFIADSRKEEETVKAKYENDIKRFKELKAIK